jgi:hypothetical protein
VRRPTCSRVGLSEAENQQRSRTSSGSVGSYAYEYREPAKKWSSDVSKELGFKVELRLP